ncbi:MAG TPA: GNAT family N-acetyltransferase [Thermomicrobiales bacterium]|nr:GNAT family N-acetyltransferase [Thermomicrobiales bacterium]
MNVSIKVRGSVENARQAVVESLLPGDVLSLPLGWRNRFDREEIASLLENYPGRSAWEPESGEFVLAAPWRHRDEVAMLAELASVRHVRPLIDGLVERCREKGARLVLTAEMHERQRPEFWKSVGLDPLEDVISFTLTVSNGGSQVNSRLEFERVEPGNRDRIDELVVIDNTSFPWLWWNNRTEFDAYLVTGGVEVYLVKLEGRAVGYVGMTRYQGWMHLDRIAIAPRYQGHGHGRAALEFVLSRTRELGFVRVALSTQRENRHSRSLYAAMGFQRSRENDYRIYGRWLVDPRTLPGPGNGISSDGVRSPLKDKKEPVRGQHIRTDL